MRRSFCASAIGFDGFFVAIDDIVVDAVLEVMAGRCDPPKPSRVRVVLAEQELRAAIAEKPQLGAGLR